MNHTFTFRALQLLALVACSDAASSPSGTGSVDPVNEDASTPVGMPKPDASAAPPDGGTTSLPDAMAATDVARPRFASTATFSTTVPSTNDPMDVVYPNPADLRTAGYKFPLVVLIQGGNVDKANYTSFAETVAKYGFIVATPNHTRTVFLLTGLYPEPASIIAAFGYLSSEAARSGSPLAGIADTTSYGVLGHSLGSVTGLDMISQGCTSPACPGPFTSPAQLKGGAFYGASLKPLIGSTIPVTNNRNLGVAILQGSVDGQNPSANAQGTYDKLSTPPRAYITVNGANHYGITNTNNPGGSMADSRTPTLTQSVSIETIARWSAVFLLATVSGDPAAKDYVMNTGKTKDSNVSVSSAF